MTVVKKLTILNILIYILTVILQNLNIDVINTFALFPTNSDNYSYYQWVTHMFLHGSTLHILFNMLALYTIGPHVESYFKKNFIIFYILCGIGASLIQFLFVPNSALIGASGAIFGIIIVYALLNPNKKLFLFLILPIKSKILIPLILIFELYAGLFTSGDGIGHMAHVGGAISGFLYFLLSKLNK